MATAYYLKSGAGAVQFQLSHAYISGDKMVPLRSDVGTNAALAKAWVWECTTGGTSAGANPTWPASVTQDVTTVTSTGATFTARKPGYSSGSTANWAFASIFMDYIANASGPLAAGDTVYVSQAHAESNAVSVTYAFPGTAVAPSFVQCVNDGAAPPTTTSTGGSITTTSSSNITMSNTAAKVLFWDGVNVNCGTTAVTTTLTTSTTTGQTIISNCTLFLKSTTSGTNITIGGSQQSYNEFRNVTLNFSAGGQACSVNGRLWWSGGGICTAGTALTNFISPQGGSDTTIEDVDMSGFGSSFNLVVPAVGVLLKFKRCKMPASWTRSLTSSAAGLNFRVECYQCDTNSTNYTIDFSDTAGTIVTETTDVKTGGVTDGTTPISWKMVSSTQTAWPTRGLLSPDIVKLVTATGSTITFSVDFLHDNVTGLLDNDIVLEIDYLGTSGNPLGSKVTSMTATLLTTPATLASSGSTWTTSGLTNPNKQKLSVTFTPQKQGYVVARVRLLKASYTVYVNGRLD